ncbi:MAG: hydantoinase/oxoprolinase family protein [Chloroflexi bacterium]|nr:hydantoinase/oxoprolinase family protein [Chloroflexota bacterium]
MKTERKIKIIGSDAGGTMTDMIMVDEMGDFVVGKASTTPRDESIGFLDSLEDAFERWNMDWKKEAQTVLPDVQATVYSGTAMLNVLLTRTGRKVGLVITKGFEDTLLHERGGGVHAGYGFQDKMHKVTHIHNEPFIPKRLIRGVTERVSMFGEVAVPLYEDEVRKAVADLLDRTVESIVILFLFSYLNPVHEKRAGEIAREVMKEKGRQVPVHLSCEIMPITREGSRLNALVLQAYGAEPARGQLLRIERKLKDRGYKYPLQIILSDGGIANVNYPALCKACFSGPIGGILGGRYLSRVTGMPNLVCTDMGGTSFDVGLIMGGEPIIVREIELGRTVLNIPTLVMDSIGAGCGQYITIDPESKRVDIGPGSAGADPGPVCYNMGTQIPTVMDCVLILGVLNPDYYLGGKMKLHKDLALKAIKEKCADPMGVDPYRFAEGVVSLISTRMREHIGTVLSVRGYSISDYHLIGYGGAGPMFLSGYTDGMPFKGVLTVPWAAAFSAFGCTTADYLHRYQRSTLVAIQPGADEMIKKHAGTMISASWQELEETAIREMTEEGFRKEDITFQQVAYVRYSQQLEDVEVFSPLPRLKTAQDVDKLIEAFEDVYSRKYSHAATFPEMGYQIFELGLIASVPKPKPELRKYRLEGKAPATEAFKGERALYVKGEWKKAKLYEMDRLRSGNEVEGLAILEAPATTMPVPEGKKVVVDEYKIYWLKEA